MTVLSAGVLTLTAKLAPASYSNPQQVQTTLLGTSSALDLVLITPTVWIAQGATVNLPIVARVLSNGVPVSGKTLNYQITAGSGALSCRVGSDRFEWQCFGESANQFAGGIDSRQRLRRTR